MAPASFGATGETFDENHDPWVHVLVNGSS
jgi:hypothetical protein